MPKTKGVDRPGMWTSRRCMHGHGSHGRMPLQATSDPRPDPRQGDGNTASCGRGGTRPFGQQQPGRGVLHLQLLHLLLWHPARHGRAGNRKRGGKILHLSTRWMMRSAVAVRNASDPASSMRSRWTVCWQRWTPSAASDAAYAYSPAPQARSALPGVLKKKCCKSR